MNLPVFEPIFDGQIVDLLKGLIDGKFGIAGTKAVTMPRCRDSHRDL